MKINTPAAIGQKLLACLLLPVLVRNLKFTEYVIHNSLSTIMQHELKH